MDIESKSRATKEKGFVALSSVIAAVFLTSMKLVVGLLTGSLGILSEAAHSGLDLVAAIVTMFAVRFSDRPADIDHTYGHGKVENFSALIETVLLFITCGWIIYEAVERLFFKSVHVEVSYWSFIVMGISILVDITRSKALMRVAKRHGSQALEADALHFSTDVWSSSVVIAGLILVFTSRLVQNSQPALASWLYRADAIAALAVSGIVIYVSYQLGKRAINTLLDSVPSGLNARLVKAVSVLPGVLAVDRIRSRLSGPDCFVDMTLAVARDTSLEEAHAIAVHAETVVQNILPRADVMVHVDPVVHDDRSLLEKIHSVSGRRGIAVHGIHLNDVRGRMSAELHAEVPEDLTVAEAHHLVSGLEQAIRSEIPVLAEVNVHIEPTGEDGLKTEAVQVSSAEIQSALNRLPAEIPGLADCHSVTILQGKDSSVTFHCTLDPSMPITRAHDITVEIEKKLRASLPALGRIIIHVEPPEA